LAFRNYDDHWCVRCEGDDGMTGYDGRDKAIEAARLYGRACGSYRLYLQLTDGRVTQELFNLASSSSPVSLAEAEGGGREAPAALRPVKAFLSFSANALFPPNGGTGMAS
jgi:hypothetical protein